MRAIDVGILVCRECHKLSRVSDNNGSCPRCGSRLHERYPNSIARTWALLVTALILYIPANTMPIMTVYYLGSGMPATIMEGVIEFIHADMWGIAAIVFIASIVVPTFKLIGMGLLLYSVQRRQLMPPRQRIFMFRFIEWIGRWSMLDIFVIAIMVAVVSFGQLAQVVPGMGSIAFALVVVTTMFAAMSFDPRLIWDTTEDGSDPAILHAVAAVNPERKEKYV